MKESPRKCKNTRMHQAEQMIQKLNKESEEIELTMSNCKAKLITHLTPYEIKDNEPLLEYVEEYIYLG